MRYIEKTKLIERIDDLIRRKATGSARDLASRLGIGKSTVYEVLEIMKMMGAEIEYSNNRKSYFYNSNKIFAIGFVDPDKIKGGKSFFVQNFRTTYIYI